MKKKILIGAGIVSFLIIAVLLYAFILSFKVVKKNTDSINADFKNQFQKIVRIPDPVAPSYKGFHGTIYMWDMETREKEITKVTFVHDTAFPRNQEKIVASLEMPEGQDQSIFDKVLSSVISDIQALDAVKNPQHPSLGANTDIGYNKVEIFPSAKDPSKVVKITWEFDRDKLTRPGQQYFDNLYKYPESIITKLYFIQRSTLILLAP